MADYVLSPAAADDLTNAYSYLAARNPPAADRFMERVHATLQRLADAPHIGRDRSELHPNLRSFAVSPHVVFYRPTEAGVEIARVLHGKRDLARLLRQKAP